MTTFPTLLSSDFQSRLAANFPRGWASQDGLQVGNAGAFFNALGEQLSYTLTQLQYALAAQRMQTETSPELDLASKDYLGDTLPRPVGYSDAQYYALIKSNLFKKVATREALSDAITRAVGTAPRMIEPWNPADTGARDTLVSFRDVDTAENPMLNTSAFLGYNGFIRTVFPYSLAVSHNPFYTRDDSGYMDANDYQVDITSSSEADLYALVDAIHAYGTTVWIQQLINSWRILSNGGVLVVYTTDFIYPTSYVGLPDGALYLNSDVVCVAGTTTPDTAQTQLVFPEFTVAELFSVGGANMPLSPPQAGSGILWNNGGVVCVA